MTNKFVSIVTLMVFVLGFGAAPAWSGEDEKVAKELTLLLKASRAVLVQHKPLIKNPMGAGIDVNKFLDFTYANYGKMAGKPFKRVRGPVGKAQSMLILAIQDVVGDVVSGADKKLDPQGRFLPAIYARKVAAQFGKVSGGKMYLGIASNKADAWEKSVIEGKFLDELWQKGKTFSQVTQHKGKKAFRLILPEYYKAGCMGCHGGTNGASIHAGKKAGRIGELGGAISVAIYK